ncbi:hypothetical protein NPIL_476211 [Nephila pilipes]|uniref:Uncharacterized protein n=1 Tax=Nephila pilipes TaxID=299642 RepID=A0A8X6UCN3_NEPPI|nr:hypothetical protein NPIL_476211 [Nephila pilipes]
MEDKNRTFNMKDPNDLETIRIMYFFDSDDDEDTDLNDCDTDEEDHSLEKEGESESELSTASNSEEDKDDRSTDVYIAHLKKKTETSSNHGNSRIIHSRKLNKHIAIYVSMFLQLSGEQKI